MNTEALNRWLTLSANIGVVAGLIFLAIEINQNTRATIAAASEEVTNQSLDYFALGMDNEVIARALYKKSSDEELSGFELDQLWRHQFFNFRVFQNVHSQYRRGFLEEEEWKTYQQVIASRFVSDPITVRMWEDTNGGWTPKFQEAVNEIRENSIEQPVVGFK
jgi:hypothetical protein